MRTTTRQTILDWFHANRTGSMETVALALKIKPSTVYFNLRALLCAGDLKHGPSEMVMDGRGRACTRLTYVVADRDAEAQPPMTMVQRALAARPALQTVWGARC
jgi:predicted ArsR family transcriptional regulator